MAIDFPNEELLADLGVDAIYTNPAGGRSDIKVLFDRGYSQSQVGSTDVDNMAPSASCLSTDVASADISATLEVDEVVYKILSIQPDGEGMTYLVLSKE